MIDDIHIQVTLRLKGYSIAFVTLVFFLAFILPVFGHNDAFAQCTGYGCDSGVNAFVPTPSCVTPTPSPCVTATPTPVTGFMLTAEIVSPTSTLTPTPTKTPGICNASCLDTSECQSGMVCAVVETVKRCRNTVCMSSYTCICPTLTPTVTPTPLVEIVIVTPLPVPKTPVSGTFPFMGTVTISGAVLLLLLGLLL